MTFAFSYKHKNYTMPMTGLRAFCLLSLALGCLSMESNFMIDEVPVNVMNYHMLGHNVFANLQMDKAHHQDKFVEALQHANFHSENNELMDGFAESLSYADITSSCSEDVQFLINLLSSNKSSDQLLKGVALQYADSMTKIPYGILLGKWLWEGSYQQCQLIDTVTNPHNNNTFKGLYMTGVINTNGNQPVLGANPLCVGFCAPDSCTEAEAKILLQAGLAYVVPLLRLQQFNLTATRVVSSKMPELSSAAIATLAVVGVLTFIIILGTLVDYLCGDGEQNKMVVVNRNEEIDEPAGILSGEVFSETVQQEQRFQGLRVIVVEIFKAFSFRSNSVKLFGTKTAEGPLACLNGIRVLSMFWIILGHTFYMVISITDNTAYAINLVKRFTFQPILNGTFSVDSFFFLSGLLVAYLSIREIKEKGSLNWIYFFVHRYWRLTPLLAFVILIFTNMFPYIFYGPFRFLVTVSHEQSDPCQSYWWTNLLYINNFYPYYGNIQKTCIDWSWYLANDMQFYVFISPLVILTLTRRKILGYLTVAFLIVSCILIRGALVLYYGMYGLQAMHTKHMDEPMGKNGALYGRPYARQSVYVIGMFTGYVLAVNKNRIRMYRSVALLGWVVAIATGLSVIYGQYYYNHHSNEKPAPHMTLVASMFYVSLCRTAWGFCLAWVVLACVAGKGGVVKDILSWKLWAPLGRLTYSAYLIHPITTFFYYFNQDRPLQLSDLSVVYLFIGNLVVAYGVSFVVSMAVEAPMIQLEKLIVKAIKSFRSRSQYVNF